MGPNEVICTGNELVGLPAFTPGGNPAGEPLSLLQSWSRSGVWKLTFENNSIENTNYVIKIAMSATFYSMDHITSVIARGTGTHSGIEDDVSFVFPWDDPPANYNPVNVASFPNPITYTF